MIEYTIKVQHDEDEISVTILDLDPETYEKDRDAIIGALFGFASLAVFVFMLLAY